MPVCLNNPGSGSTFRDVTSGRDSPFQPVQSHIRHYRRNDTFDNPKYYQIPGKSQFLMNVMLHCFECYKITKGYAVAF
jgi:hypothetical protein